MTGTTPSAKWAGLAPFRCAVTCWQVDAMIDQRTSVLLTDLYQLTMLQAYFDRGMNDTAVFELFVRKLPRERNFLLAAGLEQVLDYLANLRFTREELDWLLSSGRLTAEFLQ